MLSEQRVFKNHQRLDCRIYGCLQLKKLAIRRWVSFVHNAQGIIHASQSTSVLEHKAFQY